MMLGGISKGHAAANVISLLEFGNVLRENGTVPCLQGSDLGASLVEALRV